MPPGIPLSDAPIYLLAGIAAGRPSRRRFVDLTVCGDRRVRCERLRSLTSAFRPARSRPAICQRASAAFSAWEFLKCFCYLFRIAVTNECDERCRIGEGVR